MSVSVAPAFGSVIVTLAKGLMGCCEVVVCPATVPVIVGLAAVLVGAMPVKP